ncbi:MAG: phage tail tip lysozyme [Hyphomonadaceae bacterium]|nr:phage tail tip lysozyme [Hyphomonadaceae bacterium]
MDLFKETVSLLTWALRAAFPQLGALDIAAIIGNAAHECNGFKTLQEIKPTVQGSLGGYGYFQWTGPRRRAFMAWCKQNGLKPESSEANIGFLIYELQTSEAGAIPRTRKAKTLEDKVIAFELGFARAGIKHYPSRIKWAKQALAAMPDARKKEPEVEAMIPPPPKPLAKSKTIWSEIGKIGTIGGSVSAALAGIDWQTVLVVGLLAFAGLAAWTIYERVKKG